MKTSEQIEESRVYWAQFQTEPSAEYPDENDQDGSFLNDDYCDALEMEIHD